MLVFGLGRIALFVGSLRHHSATIHKEIADRVPGMDITAMPANCFQEVGQPRHHPAIPQQCRTEDITSGIERRNLVQVFIRARKVRAFAHAATTRRSLQTRATTRSLPERHPSISRSLLATSEKVMPMAALGSLVMLPMDRILRYHVRTIEIPRKLRTRYEDLGVSENRGP